MKKQVILSRATGKRKRAIATTMLVNGDGKILIKKRNEHNIEEVIHIDNYPIDITYKKKILHPIEVLKNKANLNFDKFDFIFKLSGGGMNGQAEAAALAISKALLAYSPEEYGTLLRAHELLTRDPRIVLPKLYGLKKNRKRRQYRKR